MFENTDTAKLFLGRLTWDSLAIFHDPIILVTFIGVVLGGIAVLGAMTYFKLWGPFWRNWVTSVDHKKIGIMYIVLAIIM
ncbi:MAG: cytochrome o ubiquinol oxidase subunit I, partial [Lautropia sp.]|nr:cytochrome o ubiquinol oxidase subunit I [Lautropia sp.]